MPNSIRRPPKEGDAPPPAAEPLGTCWEKHCKKPITSPHFCSYNKNHVLCSVECKERHEKAGYLVHIGKRKGENIKKEE